MTFNMANKKVYNHFSLAPVPDFAKLISIQHAGIERCGVHVFHVMGYMIGVKMTPEERSQSGMKYQRMFISLF